MKLRLFLSFVSAACVLSGCMQVNSELGRDLIATNQRYDIYSIEIPVTDISLDVPDSLSGMSSKRITVGAIREEEFGLTTRGAAFALVPILDTLDFGKDAIFKQFHFATAADTVSLADESERYIIQKINVYELSEPIDFETYNTNTTIAHKPGRITRGVPMYAGGDSLSFDFSEEFGRKYMQILQEDLDTMTAYTAKFPGIYIETDAPVGNGGRINMFELSCLSVYSSAFYRNNNVAELKFSAVYDGERKDTSFLFIYGEPYFYDEVAYVDAGVRIPQYSFNVTGHESRDRVGAAGSVIPVEGGGGLKPVIAAADIRSKVIAEISKNGAPEDVIINKATLHLPFEMPEDYKELDLFPTTLNPTCRVKTDTSITFAGLTDSSNSSENQGTIDRSNLEYCPDITHHLQELIKLKDTDKLSNYDVWFLIVSSETEETANSSSYNEYYQNLMYASYYNSLYGYGNYGYGYGSGYSSYSNYYNYMMLAQMYSGTSSTSTTSELDITRFYRASLNGPAATGVRTPTLKVVYSLPRK
ncbi:MAG: hypothetical protein IK143_05130 [Bacteroidales bacterium]|nr:hypothetical protein [Bacteroidales bacterium]